MDRLSAISLHRAVDGGLRRRDAAEAGVEPHGLDGRTRSFRALVTATACQGWGPAMTTFFTSDTHFGDLRVLRFDHRPFPTLDAHDAGLIAHWNARVTPGDIVWHLDDFALGPSPQRAATILDALAGEKHLVLGNNDDAATLALPGWASVGHYAEIAVDGRRLVLCHYAFRTWNGIGRGAVNLHGHSHNKLTPLPKQYDVGVDAQDFRPVTLPEILTSRKRGARGPKAGSA